MPDDTERSQNATERPLNELWRMLAEVEENAFLGYREKWGEEFPPGDWVEAPRKIRARIEAAIRADERARIVALLRSEAFLELVREQQGYHWEGDTDVLAESARAVEAQGETPRLP